MWVPLRRPSLGLNSLLPFKQVFVEGSKNGITDIMGMKIP